MSEESIPLNKDLDLNKDPNESLPPEGGKTPPEGGGEEADNSPGNVSIKDELGKTLGKEFPDDATALKAVKDTFSFVGEIGNIKELKEAMSQLQKVFNTDQKGVLAKVDEIVKTGGTGKVDPTQFVSKDKYDRSTFYLNNPDYKPYSKLIETFQKANPEKTREEIVESDDFKGDFDKIKAHDEAKNTKSILETSPRLGKVTDKLSEAREAQEKGDQTTAETKAVEAVTEAFPVKPSDA